MKLHLKNCIYQRLEFKAFPSTAPYTTKLRINYMQYFVIFKLFLMLPCEATNTPLPYICLQKNPYKMFQVFNLLGIGLRTSGMRISTKAWYITWSQLHIHFRIDSFLHRVISFALGSRLSISLRLLVFKKMQQINK